MDIKFDNITISGGIGVGTSTLLGNLKTPLSPLGYRFKSTGDFFRAHTKENIMPVSTLVSDDFDRKIEQDVYTCLKKEKKWVIEGWLAGFVARDLKKTLKILLICSIESLRIDRITNRDKVSIKNAKKYIKQREDKNFEKWQRIYGNYNFFDQKYYDLVIDTFATGPDETVEKVLDRLGFIANK